MATIRLIPSTYAVSDTTYVTTSNPNNALTNTDSTTYGQFTHNRSQNTTYYVYLRGFNFSDVPSDAIINSFTVKIRGLESGLSTNSSYRVRLCNNTSEISNTTASTSFGTNNQTITIPNGSLTWNTITGYGSNFGIYIPLRRASRNTSGYVRIYGAEILVDYTIPVYHNVSVTNNSEIATVSPTGQQSILEGEDFVITIIGVDDISDIKVTDNGTDVTDDLDILPLHYSVELNPVKFVSSSTTVTNQNNACTGTDSTTYARMPIGQRVQNHMIYAFDTPSIPSDATISSVSCVVKASTSTSGNITTKTVQLYSGSSAKGSPSTIPTTTGGTVTLTPGTWTRQELEEVQIRFDGYYSGSSSTYYIDFYGADLTIYYTVEGNDYTYTISNISADHSVVVIDVSPLYYKNGSNWSRYKFAYKKVNGAWVMQTPSDVIDFFKETRIMEKYGTIYLKG
jgi:hypothetical protein